MAKPVRALVSVSDKRGLVPFARQLAGAGIQILSTGGTARALMDANLSSVSVAEHTGAPEILDGRVKTLHPKIHGGILGRPTAEHEAQMREHAIDPIDIVVVNLYPFEETVARPDVELAEAVEQIDIGGPAMLRSSAKNFERVTVVVDPADYDAVAAELTASGEVCRDTRFRLAKKAFAHTARYDAAIVGYLEGMGAKGEGAPSLPETMSLRWERARSLRYGENPHQEAAFYVRDAAGRDCAPSLATAEVVQGKELSYNNLLDLDAALECVLEMGAPAAVVVKHTNPCGVAMHVSSLTQAYRWARQCDPVSAFGGIVAVNRPVDAELAGELTETFLECVIAPSIDEAALALLAKKKNLRVVVTGAWPEDFHRGKRPPSWHAVRSVSGGVLVQSPDVEIARPGSEKQASGRAPTDEEYRGLRFAWRVAKHVKSNAIVYARAMPEGAMTVGVGAGQMSRVDSAAIARRKAELASLDLKGSVVASDAFFPFRDGLDVLAEAGATAVIQPGGSRRDDEVIAAADEHDIAMLFTGTRHFRH